MTRLSLPMFIFVICFADGAPAAVPVPILGVDFGSLPKVPAAENCGTGVVVDELCVADIVGGGFVQRQIEGSSYIETTVQDGSSFQRDGFVQTILDASSGGISGVATEIPVNSPSEENSDSAGPGSAGFTQRQIDSQDEPIVVSPDEECEMVTQLGASHDVVKMQNSSAQLAVGDRHTVLIKSDGTLWTWGENKNGQLGDCSYEGKATPIQISSETWKSVSASMVHTLAIKSDGTLWGWGMNTHGQLGDGTTEPKSRPVQIGTDKWQAVDTGYLFSIGIKADGTLWIWGQDSLEDKTVPTQIGNETWSVVSANFGHIVALKSDGTLWAWGDNSYGQLGDGTTEAKSAPVPIGYDEWDAVAVGNAFTVGIKRDGTLWGWGRNSSGWMGDGTTDDKLYPAQMGSDHWSDISAGYGHILGIKNDGSLWGWRWNIYGQLDATMSVPTRIDDDRWSVVQAGWSHSAGIKRDGTVWAWDTNHSGQFGDDDWKAAPQFITAQDVTPPTGRVSINSDALSTSDKNVSLSVACNDNYFCKSMQFSTDQLVWFNVEPYANVATWKLGKDEGEQSVYVRLIDGAGNETVLSDAITLQPKPPSNRIDGAGDESILADTVTSESEPQPQSSSSQNVTSATDSTGGGGVWSFSSMLIVMLGSVVRYQWIRFNKAISEA